MVALNYLNFEKKKPFSKKGSCFPKKEAVPGKKKLFPKKRSCSWKKEAVSQKKKLFLEKGSCSPKKEGVLGRRKLFSKRFLQFKKKENDAFLPPYPKTGPFPNATMIKNPKFEIRNKS